MANSEITRLIREAEAQGFTAQRTGGGHYLIRTANRQVVTTVPSTPSDWRGFRNTIAALRRYGFIWKGRS